MADDDQVGNAMVQPCTAGDLKKNTVAIIKGHPCKVMEIRVSKTGKHGHAKCSITGVDVLTGKKYTDVQPSHAPMYIANCEKREYQLMDINKADLTASCLDDNSDTVTVNLDNDEGKRLVEEYDPDDADNDVFVTVMSAPEEISENVFVRKEQVSGFKKQKGQPV